MIETRRPRMNGFTIVGCGFAVLWLFSFLFSIAATVGLIYVAIHFIMKFW